MKKPLITTSLLGALALCSVAAPARAQETQPPPASSAPTSPPPASSSGSGFGGGAIGIGAVTSFAPDGPGVDALLVYDQPVFHIDVALGYDHTSQNNASNSDFRFGVGGWFHLARASMADFSLGGSVALLYVSGAGANASYTAFAIDPGATARLFLAPQFALTGRVGLEISFGDNGRPTTFSINGATVAAFGFTYFFR
jgi:hypothetical protein